MHALVYAAESLQKDHELVEGLFKAFFIDGVDLSQRDNVSSVAQSTGIEEKLIDSVFDDDLYLDRIHEDMQQAAKIGIQGVPFFIINQKLGLSGAQPAATIVKAIEESTS
jgi:predicted DsbA family dithiol-disulfide isomerase